MRAIGIIRVSQRKGRKGESFLSPGDQRDRIADACERDGLAPIAIYEEIDVSGGTPLVKRDGLRSAVEAIEAGRADVVMVAYFDRLVRDLGVQREVVDRVEAAGGRVVALDFGTVTGKTATQWLSGTLHGAFAEYQRRVTRERAGAAQKRAVARGVAPFASVPPGYRRRSDKLLEPDPEVAPIIVEAFRRRAAGETIKEVRAFLRAEGIRRSYHGVQSMLKSKIYLGEVHFGKLANLEAHEPLIDRDLWRQVQGVPRGSRAKSDHLLSRLGILRCGTCGARMVIGTQRQNGRVYPFYRCPPVGDCERRFAISAAIAEQVVIEATQAALVDVVGRAAADSLDAEDAAERAQQELEAAIRAFAAVEDEPAAIERLRELRAARDASRDRAHELRGLRAARVVGAADWDRLTPAERRALIVAVIDRVVVGPGKGASRLQVFPK
jgi:DNA invertase Pin-like site-specific DNA recombinase